MKETNVLSQLGKRMLPAFRRYKFVILVILVGLVLLMLPDSQPETTAQEKAILGTEENFSVEALEEKLAQTLSEIEGVGKVSVMLTVQSGMKRVLAQDKSVEQEEGRVKQEAETVVVSAGSGVEDVVLVQQVYPQFQGALVVAEGGADPAIKLKLTEAVAALTGLGADKISICKGK